MGSACIDRGLRRAGISDPSITSGDKRRIDCPFSNFLWIPFLNGVLVMINYSLPDWSSTGTEAEAEASAFKAFSFIFRFTFFSRFLRVRFSRSASSLPSLSFLFASSRASIFLLRSRRITRRFLPGFLLLSLAPSTDCVVTVPLTSAFCPKANVDVPRKMLTLHGTSSPQFLLFIPCKTSSPDRAAN